MMCLPKSLTSKIYLDDHYSDLAVITVQLHETVKVLTRHALHSTQVLWLPHGKAWWPEVKGLPYGWAVPASATRVRHA